MLGDRYTLGDVREALLPHGEWAAYPSASDRAPWEALPGQLRQRLLAAGESCLAHDWPSLPATLFLEYAREGSRDRYQTARYARRHALRDLVLAECVEGAGRFLDDVVNGIWATCEETYWGVPAHLYMQRAGEGLPDVEEPTVDLFAAETAALLSWTLNLLGSRLDDVSPLVRPRVVREASCRVLDPCLERDDFWWMSLVPSAHSVNNWNPWISSNWLTTVLLLERDDLRRAIAVHKILRCLDGFLASYADDGGCDEGPGYWGRAAASLFDCLDLLASATRGRIDIWSETKVRNMGRFIYRTHIDNGYYVNFADASATARPVPSLVYRYGKAIGDAEMAGFGAWLLGDEPAQMGKQEGSLGRILPAFFDVPRPIDVVPSPPYPRDAWFDGIQVMVARDRAGDPSGLFVAAKAGHNGESHNHNDVGSCIVYVGGRPLIVDAGVETYRRQTFSSQRYGIWTMQSAFHTLLPTFNGMQQAPGKAHGAHDVTYRADEEVAVLSMELSGAYPAADTVTDVAGLKTWRRRLTLLRGKALTITDAFRLSGAVDEISLSLLTPCRVVLEDGCVRLEAAQFGPEGSRRTSAQGRLRYPQAVSDVAALQIPIRDRRLGSVWGSSLCRVLFSVHSPPPDDVWVWTVEP